jgi:hypothetical protein
MDSVSLRVQRLSLADQVLALGRLAEARSESGRFGPSAIDELFDDLALPRPAKVSNVLARLEGTGHVSRARHGRGSWRLTPAGRAKSTALIADLDLAALVAEAASEHPALFGSTTHPLIPPSLAPPELLSPLRAFLEDHPFDSNVFGMTRFPDEQDESNPDPVATALQAARTACKAHGLEFHLASDRMIVDDLWANVAAHMWACRYGIAFFEDRTKRGINYNLTIEVGGMLVAGRRLALLKDTSIERLPTDLVGKIYKSLDFDDLDAMASAIHLWLKDDLGLGACPQCPAQ